jgi:hypothetical protein
LDPIVGIVLGLTTGLQLKISFNTILMPHEINKMDGYGYATDRVLASLEALGYEVTINDPTADVGFVFNQPQHARYHGNQYRILYHPWESTRLIEKNTHLNPSLNPSLKGKNWQGVMNAVDEVWTPSPLVASWYHEYAGVTTPVYVYEHGVDRIWTPRFREREDKLSFLHVGGEAVRKGLTETLKGFRRAFPGQDDVELTLKIISKSWKVPKFFRVVVYNDRYKIEELVDMYHRNHVYVYPSWGEGFGLTPLQAMATGMPTMTSKVWAPYANFLDPNLALGGTLVNSPWPAIHPGKMIKPDVDEIIDKYRYCYENYDSLRDYAMSITPSVAAHYDWNTLTAAAFGALEERLKN